MVRKGRPWMEGDRGMGESWSCLLVVVVVVVQDGFDAAGVVMGEREREYGNELTVFGQEREAAL
jgi:hypothetical protein